MKKIFLIFSCLVLVFGVTGCSESESYYRKCQFKDSNGNRSCTNEATHGDLCDYHYNYLDSIYDSYTN